MTSTSTVALTTACPKYRPFLHDLRRQTGFANLEVQSALTNRMVFDSKEKRVSKVDRE